MKIVSNKYYFKYTILVLLQSVVFHQQMELEPTFQSYFQDYPLLNKAINKLHLTVPTDFQSQLLQASQPIEHLIITAPPTVGKKVALLLYSLKNFYNEESGILVVLAHSKQLSQWAHHFLSVCMGSPVINLYMQQIGQIGQKAVVVGSPLQVNNLWKKEKDKIVSIVIPQADILFGFGYGQALQLLAGSLNSSKVAYKMSCVQRSAQIEKFKSQWMKKAIKVDYEPADEEEQEEKEQQITHFYGSGDKMSIPITLYVTLKFGLVNPKILVLVQNLREVYRYALFLQRCRIANVGVYNNQDPINLRFYTLSLWMTGHTNILISTPSLLQQLKTDTFKKHSRKKYKRDSFQLVNMSAIITLGLSFVEFQSLIQHFHVKPFIMSFIQNNQKEINLLQEFISLEKNKFQHAVVKELPITRKEIQGFRYRINDVWVGLNNHKADLFRQLDFKKKLLKTPELKEQFQSNGKERQVLVKSINDLRKKIDHGKVTISEFVPQYLVPECLKASYEEKIKVMKAQKQQDTPMNHQKVKKVLRHVNLQEQNPQTTDISRLKLISARKRWKLLHGFKLKRKNKRLQRKGVFQS